MHHFNINYEGIDGQWNYRYSCTNLMQEKSQKNAWENPRSSRYNIYKAKDSADHRSFSESRLLPSIS